MKVYFSHGKESGPWGSKIKALAEIAREMGCAVESVGYSDLSDPDLRVERLLDELSREKDQVVLVGSSMGGYVSLVAADEVRTRGLFLMAPALYMKGYQQQTYTDKPRIEIVHGWDDDVVPPEGSIRFARKADCTLHLVRGDHRLKSSLDEVERLFRSFLATVLADSGKGRA